MITFDMSKFLDIILGDHYEDQIIRQFMTDFYRVQVVINNKLQKYVDSFMLELSQYNRIETIGSKSFSIIMLTMILICQQSLYCSFAHIYFKFQRFKNHLMINDPFDDRINYYIVDNNRTNRIEITIDNKQLICCYKATYEVKNIIENKTIHLILSETIFRLDCKKCLIIYNSSN